MSSTNNGLKPLVMVGPIGDVRRCVQQVIVRREPGSKKMDRLSLLHMTPSHLHRITHMTPKGNTFLDFVLEAESLLGKPLKELGFSEEIIESDDAYILRSNDMSALDAINASENKHFAVISECNLLDIVLPYNPRDPHDKEGSMRPQTAYYMFEDEFVMLEKALLTIR